MNKLEKLISTAKKQAIQRSKQMEAAIYDRMTIDQLKELAYGNPSEERIIEIFASVDGLHLLERK
ncbi:hypothetical protein [Intestinimonas massiliensis (ex Afouda et al. 2020)]|uniref:hypothetical protein n=1 Tax=Intestinimonas massiliensis (ex Afouda et al. 2020) TaxID=1673721 RepID=UPI00067EF7D2|nr:hypothetical protein [Intestinimonas massiliensis (ex Afouda et al. 2020)]